MWRWEAASQSISHSLAFNSAEFTDSSDVEGGARTGQDRIEQDRTSRREWMGLQTVSLLPS